LEKSQKPTLSWDVGDSFWDREEKITPEENESLEAEITEDEIFHLIKGSYEEGSPGLDGFSFLFYHKFWATIKKILWFW
jgi:hypothetical protein